MATLPTSRPNQLAIERHGRLVVLTNRFETEYDAIQYYDTLCAALRDGPLAITMEAVSKLDPM